MANSSFAVGIRRGWRIHWEMVYSLAMVQLVSSLGLANGVIVGTGDPFGNGEICIRTLGNGVFIGTKLTSDFYDYIF